MKNFKTIFIALLTAICVVTGVIFAGTAVRGPSTPADPVATAMPAEAPEEERPGPDLPEPMPETPEPPGERPEDIPEPPEEELAEPEIPGPVMASAHFAMAEYRCDCPGYCDGWPTAMDPELLAMIEDLRNACGSPVIITSGVRCERRNDEVGGVSWSFHKRGHAADLYCPGMPVGQLAALAQGVGLNILPYYSSGYVHVEI